MISLFECPCARDQQLDDHKYQAEGREGNVATAFVNGEQAGISYSLIGEVATEELQAMAANLVLVRKDQVLSMKSISWLWPLTAGVGVVLVLWWLQWRRQRLVKNGIHFD
jgi:hypothetical protein